VFYLAYIIRCWDQSTIAYWMPAEMIHLMLAEMIYRCLSDTPTSKSVSQCFTLLYLMLRMDLPLLLQTHQWGSLIRPYPRRQTNLSKEKWKKEKKRADMSFWTLFIGQHVSTEKQNPTVRGSFSTWRMFSNFSTPPRQTAWTTYIWFWNK
jgi:hypothetical protein